MIPGIRWSLPISLECNKRLYFWIWFIFMASTYGSTDPLYEVFDDLKEISIGRMDFDNPKVYGDTSTFDGLVLPLIWFSPVRCVPWYLKCIRQYDRSLTGLIPKILVFSSFNILPDILSVLDNIARSRQGNPGMDPFLARVSSLYCPTITSPSKQSKIFSQSSFFSNCLSLTFLLVLYLSRNHIGCILENCILGPLWKDVCLFLQSQSKTFPTNSRCSR